MKHYENVIIFDHPLIRHKIAILRDERTSMKEFRELVEEITTLMTYESLKDGVQTTEIQVKTPLETCTQTIVSDNSVVIVPILRAGLGMVNGVHVLFPSAKVGHIGMYRNEETLDHYRTLGEEWRVKPLVWSEREMRAALDSSRKTIATANEQHIV